MKWIFITTTLFLSSFSIDCFAASLGIRDIEIGSSKKQAMELIATHKGTKCYSTSCEEKTEIIRPVKITYLFGKHIEKLLFIKTDFQTFNYATMLQAMIDKYGKEDKTEDEPWENKAGVKYTNTVSTWNRPDGILKVKLIGSRTGFGSIEMISSDLQEEIKLQKQQDRTAQGF